MSLLDMNIVTCYNFATNWLNEKLTHGVCHEEFFVYQAQQDITILRV
jgi:hypothetical protein